MMDRAARLGARILYARVANPRATPSGLPLLRPSRLTATWMIDRPTCSQMAWYSRVRESTAVRGFLTEGDLSVAVCNRRAILKLVVDGPEPGNPMLLSASHVAKKHSLNPGASMLSITFDAWDRFATLAGRRSHPLY